MVGLSVFFVTYCGNTIPSLGFSDWLEINVFGRRKDIFWPYTAAVLNPFVVRDAEAAFLQQHFGCHLYPYYFLAKGLDGPKDIERFRELLGRVIYEYFAVWGYACQITHIPDPSCDSALQRTIFTQAGGLPNECKEGDGFLLAEAFAEFCHNRPDLIRQMASTARQARADAGALRDNLPEL
ncbi:hypothetical protein COY33_01925 [candidate division WWE3 bacterium CG_4_10_14_0_2_um_filter_42_7]|uniref:Uncharacterized protein n=2 Tax=Katanobacteria TaxID=422282 RepID=A0A2H0X8F9_UNCKA|nr:MAG: hypothetical protein COT51_03870 [candidate division WWE3 bacterium CG08_land_8_20_14_0_20_41_15]PIZ43218.1 MAG: hypothetical protein COY33_01925 [candidate division WWE3 bacterium CG_4_10_14_0_2_um_filter_42_7]